MKLRLDLQSGLWMSNPVWSSLRPGFLNCGLWHKFVRHCRFLFHGIFLTQGSNRHLLSLLHWQTGSLPLVPPGKPLRSPGVLFSSIQFSRSVMSNFLQSHGLQHARLPCPSPTPGVCSNSYPLSWWCHPTISSSAIPLSSHLQSFPASVSSSNESVLPIRWWKYWNFIFSISPSSEYSGLISLRIDWLDLLAVQGTLKSLLQSNGSKASILQLLAFFVV